MTCRPFSSFLALMLELFLGRGGGGGFLVAGGTVASAKLGGGTDVRDMLRRPLARLVFFHTVVHMQVDVGSVGNAAACMRSSVLTRSVTGFTAIAVGIEVTAGSRTAQTAAATCVSTTSATRSRRGVSS